MPINAGPTTFAVVIPSQNSLNVDFDVAGVSNEVDSLTLGRNSQLSLGTLRSLAVTGEVDIDGLLNADNGNFAATSASVPLEIDNARMSASSSAGSIEINALDYARSGFFGFEEIFSARNGATLDLSSLTTVTNNNLNGRENVIVADNATIDLSSVTNLGVAAGGFGGFEVRVTGGGTIDLSSLQVINGQANDSSDHTSFSASNAGKIIIGPVIQAENTSITATDLGTIIDIAGSFQVDAVTSGITFNVSNGAEVQLAGNLRIEGTNESNVQLSNGIIRFDGSGAQQLDVAGTDSGPDAFTSGNFGIGQLIIGTTTQRTSLELVDIIDNGNRGPGEEPEALYLYGLGGPNGLRILNNSALVLNGLNVYAHDPLSGDQVHLNTLIGVNELRIPFDDGFLQLVPLDFQWGNNLGGDFNLGGNWNDGLVPLGSDAAIWVA